MKPSSVCLPKSEIPLLLSGDLPPDEAAAAESHIAECESCRNTIESMIADSRWWDDARKSLAASAIHVAASLRDAEDGSAEEIDAEAASLGETRLRGTRLRESVLDLLGPTDDPNMLGRIGPYEIIGLLGQGGMGAVFKGFDRSLNRFVAIKMLLPHLAASGAARKRFAREGQAVAAVVDDHVMAIHCVDEWQGVPYLVMTYSRGVSLQKRLSDNGPLEVREILRIGMQAAKGLAAAHAQGIVHRDIKPANIFLDQTVERVQLMDFGLARAVDDASLTRSGTLAGTPQYMSPEQARAETVDHRSDLFSLGSVLYAMCTGHAPFRAESSYSVLRLITDKEPRPIREINPDIPEWLCAIIGKLMAKQADERFGSANEVAEILEECLANVQHPQAKPLSKKVAALAPKMVRRPPISKFIGVAAFAFSLIFAGVLIVLELHKGTLTIESDAEDVPIRIMQGEKVVERMTVTKAGNSVRVAAGNYLVELDATMDNMVVENDKVVLSRGSTERVKIRYLSPIDEVKSGDTAVEKPLGPSLPVFDTPEALMKYAADCQNREDVAGYLSCMTDEPVKQLASGYLLISTSMLQEFKKDPDAYRPTDYAVRMKELEQVIREAVSDKDVAQSALAFATASGQMRLESKGQTFEESATRFMKDPLLHLLASITVDRLKDPRRFIVRFDAIALEDERSKAERARKVFDYVVEQVGDKAVATNKSDGNTTGLIKTANGWRINDPWYGIKTKDDLGAVPTTTPAPVADSDPQSLEFATKSYNEQTAELRRSLFQPPIPDLSIEKMREGLRKAGDDYQRRGKHQVANALQKIAETGRLPDGILLFATGVHAEDDRGGTLTRQIVPGLILPDNTSQGGHLLTPIQPLGLLYRKDGKCSKTYGDSDWDLQPGVEKPGMFAMPNTETSDLLRKLEGTWTIESIYAPQSNSEVIPDYAYKDVYVFEKNKVRIERESLTVVTGSVELKRNAGLTLTMQFDNKVDSNGKSDSHLEGSLDFKSKDEFWLAVPDTSVRPSQEAVLAGQPRVVWKMRRVVAVAPADTRRLNNLVKHYDRESSVSVVAVAPDGKTMAISSRESSAPTSWPTVSIIDIGTGNTMRTILPASEEERTMIEQSKWISALNIAALAYSPDGKKLAIGTSFGQVDIVNPETGEKILWLSDNLNGETVGPIKRIHPYPDQGTEDFAVAAMAQLKELKRAMGSVASIAFRSDGSWLATSGGSFEDQPLEFDFTGQVPASKTGPGRVKVWNVETGKRKYNFDHHLHAESIAFSGNARSRNEYFDCLLATAGIWGTGDKRFSGVRLWRMGDGNLVQELRNEDEDFPNAIAFSPDSVLLAIGLRHKTNADGVTCGIVRMVKPLAGVVWEQTVPISALKVVFIAHGNMLAVLCGRPGQEQSIQLLDANTGKLRRELKLADLSHGGAWLDFAYSVSEQLLIAVGCDKENRGTIDVWDFESRRGKD